MYIKGRPTCPLARINMRLQCVYSSSRNDVPQVAQRYGTISAHTRRRASVHYFPAQSSLDADILVYWIRKIVRTCAPSGSRTLNFLPARRAPYPLGQALGNEITSFGVCIYTDITIYAYFRFTLNTALKERPDSLYSNICEAKGIWKIMTEKFIQGCHPPRFCGLVHGMNTSIVRLFRGFLSETFQLLLL